MEATAAWLHHIGIKKGDRIAILMKNCQEVFDIYLHPDASAHLRALQLPADREMNCVSIGNSRPRLVVYSRNMPA